MKDVLYAPELRANLMSVRKLTKTGIDVVFSRSVAILKLCGETITTGHLKGGCYEITVDVDFGKLPWLVGCDQRKVNEG